MTDGTWMSGPPGQQNLDKEPDDMDKTGIQALKTTELGEENNRTEDPTH